MFCVVLCSVVKHVVGTWSEGTLGQNRTSCEDVVRSLHEAPEPDVPSRRIVGSVRYYGTAVCYCVIFV